MKNITADNDILSYSISEKGGRLFLDIKQDSEGKEYLKITQSRPEGDRGFHRENIYINKEEILQLRDELDKVIEHWGQTRTEKKYTLESKREEHGNAYLPWEKNADEYLIKLYKEGKKIGELSDIFERNDGAIRSRLKKLGLL